MKKRALSTCRGSTLNTILNSKLFAQALGRLSQEAIVLSRSLVQLLRWQVPSSLLAYNYYDGSVAIDGVAAYLKVETGLIFAARSARAGAGKMCTLVFVKRAGVWLSEQQITCLGGAWLCSPFTNGSHAHRP